MLAAARSEESRILQLFHLALRMASEGRTDVPRQLSSYFDSVLSQAISLIQDPSTVRGSIMPEAVQLAVDLKEQAELREVVSRLSSFSTVTPADASAILDKLERKLEVQH